MKKTEAHTPHDRANRRIATRRRGARGRRTQPEGAPPAAIPAHGALEGRIHLRSGHWEWRVSLPGPGGPGSGPALILNLDRPGSSAMRSRLAPSTAQLSDDEVARLALDPDERTWADGAGALWILEPDRRADGAADGALLRGFLRCRDHTPRKRQVVRWTAGFTLGSLTEDEIEIIVRVAGLQRSAKQWKRVADDMLATGRLSAVSTSARRLR